MIKDLTAKVIGGKEKDACAQVRAKRKIALAMKGKQFTYEQRIGNNCPLYEILYIKMATINEMKSKVCAHNQVMMTSKWKLIYCELKMQ